MGPLEASRPWATKDVVGAHRFLQRVWRLVVDETTGADKGFRGCRWTTRRCGRCTAPSPGFATTTPSLRNNTAAAKLIEYTNHLTKAGVTARAALEPLVLMVAPLAPHLAEELWRRLGHDDVAGARSVPGGRPGVPGRPTPSSTRFRSTARSAGTSPSPPTPTRQPLEAAALADEKVQAFLAGATPKKVIVVPGRLVNLVV